jgi:hypothetical protein
VVIEKYNGTVSFRRELGVLLNAELRPNEPITRHPLGVSHAATGAFTHALSADMIAERWATVDEFAQEVVRQCKALDNW